MSQFDNKKQRLDKKTDTYLRKLKKSISEEEWENVMEISEHLISIFSENLIEVYPEKTQSEKYGTLGNLLLDKGNVAGALVCYSYGTDFKKILGDFYKKLGLNFLKKKDFPQALKYLSKVLYIERNSAENQANIATVYANLQNWKKAIIHYKRAISINPELVEVYRNLARVFTKIGQKKEATKYWNKAYILSLNLVSDDEYYELGNSLLKEKETEKAIACYQKVIELNPDYILAYDILGQILVEQDQHKEAIEIYEKFAFILIDKKRYKEAIESYKRAIQSSKKLGNISDDLIAKYQQVIENYSESSAEDYFELGRLLRSQSKFDEAIDCFIKSLDLDPHFIDTHIWLQYTKMDQNQQEKVINYYLNLVEKHPKFGLAWGNLGDFLTKINKPEEAINCYQKSAYLKAINKYPELESLNWPDKKQKSPHFLIIGATKSGTTSLWGYINSHPQVLSPHKKEISFFNKYINCGFNWYLSHFPSITDNSEYITGEATPAYLSSLGVESKVAKFCPNVKLIVLLRNPVNHVISWHYHKVNSGISQKTIEQAIVEELKPISNLSEEQIICKLTHQTYNLMSCLYYYYLKRWFEYFPREQFLIIKSEDFFENPEKIIQETYQFLGLPEYKLTEFPKLNVGYYPEISNKIKNDLKEYFRPHNQKLEDLLGMQFNWN